MIVRDFDLTISSSSRLCDSGNNKNPMENRGETAMEETTIQSEKAVSEHKTPTPIPQTDQTPPLQTSPNSGIDLRKPATPDRLKVPKAFKYPERYTFFFS